MNEFEEILKRWLPICNNDNDREKALDIFNTIFDNLISNYIKVIYPIKDVISELSSRYEMVSSGALCYYASVLMAQSNDLDHTSPNIDRFVTLYLLIDYIFDDPNINSQKKSNIIIYLTDLLSDRNPIITDPHCSLLYHYLHPLIEGNDNNKTILLKLLLAEVESIKIQTRCDLSRDDYMKISEKKGGLTLQAIKSILGGSVNIDDYILGSSIQFVDDFLDIEEDKIDGITTIFIHDINHNHVLDDSIIELAKQINNLPNNNSIFKISLLLLLVHGICRVDYFSQSIKSLVNNFNWMPKIKLSTIIGKKILDKCDRKIT